MPLNKNKSNILIMDFKIQMLSYILIMDFILKFQRTLQ